MWLLHQICCYIFDFILFGVCRGFLNLNMYVFHQIWEFFSHFFKYFSCVCLCFLSFWCSNNMNVKPFDSVLPVLRICSFFPFNLFFSLFFRLDNFYWATSKFIETHFSVCYTIEPIQWIFKISDVVFLSSKISIWFLFYNLYFSAEILIFLFIPNYFHSLKYIYFDLGEHIYTR